MAPRAIGVVGAYTKKGDVELAKGLPVNCLTLLLRAMEYARNAGRPLWDFAVSIDELRAGGLRDCDLLWLISKGCVRHRREISPIGSLERVFESEHESRLTGRSAFVLTAKGRRLVLRVRSTCVAARVEDQSADSSAAAREGMPSWDSRRRELRVGVVLVKRFSVPADNQETVLSAFQEEGWPVRIDDPLPPVPQIDPKRRLHSTIQCLNRNQKAHLLHFHGDGRGRGLGWALREARSEPSQGRGIG